MSVQKIRESRKTERKRSTRDKRMSQSQCRPTGFCSAWEIDSGGQRFREMWRATPSFTTDTTCSRRISPPLFFSLSLFLSSTFSKVFVTWHGRDEIVNKFVLFFSLPFCLWLLPMWNGSISIGKKEREEKEYLGELFLWFSPAAALGLKENKVLFFFFYFYNRLGTDKRVSWYGHDDTGMNGVRRESYTIAIASLPCFFFISSVRARTKIGTGIGSKKNFSTSLDLFLFFFFCFLVREL